MVGAWPQGLIGVPEARGWPQCASGSHGLVQADAGISGVGPLPARARAGSIQHGARHGARCGRLWGPPGASHSARTRAPRTCTAKLELSRETNRATQQGLVLPLHSIGQFKQSAQLAGAEREFAFGCVMASCRPGIVTRFRNSVTNTLSFAAPAPI